jgi:hypothetical protein
LEYRATIEEWRPTHHPDYDVSNIGRVRSRVPERGRGPRLPEGTGRLLSPSPNSQGYLHILIGGRRGKYMKVHRLVAAAFLGPCPVGQEVRHRDDDPGNPRWDNLEYGTRSDNRRDCVERGRDNSPRGERSALNSKLTTQQVIEIKQRVALLPRVGKSGRRSKYSMVSIAEQYGVSLALIHDIAYERCWAHVRI